ncbi:MAG TPA: sigma-70 family RNA polymerase sigma factor [Pirellulales bacterium]
MTEVEAIHDEPSDQELMARLTSGDHDALESLLVRYAPRVKRLAMASIDGDAAEEIVQVVFVAVWRSAATFDPARGQFCDWLLQIARNRITNELRRRGRKANHVVAIDEQTWAEPADGAPEPSEQIWQEFRRRALRGAVDALPQNQREALSLAFFDELSHAEVAAALDVPLGTAKSRIRGGLTTLRVRLAPMLASLLMLLVLAGGGIWYFHEQAVQTDRMNRALWLVTSSDIVPLRIAAVDVVDPKTHATYRGRIGEPLAVFTFSNFAAPPAGQEYRLWTKTDEEWTDLGAVPLNGAGNGRLVAENAALARQLQEFRVALQSKEDRGATSPSGKTIVRWPSEK